MSRLNERDNKGCIGILELSSQDLMDLSDDEITHPMLKMIRAITLENSQVNAKINISNDNVIMEPTFEPFKLKNKAICTLNGKTILNDVTIKPSQESRNGHPTLCIGNYPGWYLSTLQEDSLEEGIYIDFGQKYFCVNIQQLIDEAVNTLQRVL